MGLDGDDALYKTRQQKHGICHTDFGEGEKGGFVTPGLQSNGERGECGTCDIVMVKAVAGFL